MVFHIKLQINVGYLHKYPLNHRFAKKHHLHLSICKYTPQISILEEKKSPLNQLIITFDKLIYDLNVKIINKIVNFFSTKLMIY